MLPKNLEIKCKKQRYLNNKKIKKKKKKYFINGLWYFKISNKKINFHQKKLFTINLTF